MIYLSVRRWRGIVEHSVGYYSYEKTVIARMDTPKYGETLRDT